MIAIFLTNRRQLVYSPLTPALSPLRGEGARRTTLVQGTRFAAFIASRWFGPIRSDAKRTRRYPAELRHAPNATPSPLNGERAGVRGEYTNWRRFVEKIAIIESYSNL